MAKVHWDLKGQVDALQRYLHKDFEQTVDHQQCINWEAHPHGIPCGPTTTAISRPEGPRSSSRADCGARTRALDNRYRAGG
jgi:hypothetical protein